jgi:hypothetical protein
MQPLGLLPAAKLLVILLYMCPHTTLYVSSYYYICVLIPLCICALQLGLLWFPPAEQELSDRFAWQRQEAIREMNKRMLVGNPTSPIQTLLRSRSSRSYSRQPYTNACWCMLACADVC